MSLQKTVRLNSFFSSFFFCEVPENSPRACQVPFSLQQKFPQRCVTRLLQRGIRFQQRVRKLAGFAQQTCVRDRIGETQAWQSALGNS
jgi:hypothetical protein